MLRTEIVNLASKYLIFIWYCITVGSRNLIESECPILLHFRSYPVVKSVVFHVTFTDLSAPLQQLQAIGMKEWPPASLEEEMPEV